jgi:hypothetical protein
MPFLHTISDKRKSETDRFIKAEESGTLNREDPENFNEHPYRLIIELRFLRGDKYLSKRTLTDG